MSKRKNDESKAKNMTYYDVLHVSNDAGLSEIKKQFRILAVKYHPDQRPYGDANIFALIARAYACLSNENKRSEYDRILFIEKKSRKSDIFSQKKAFDEFMKAQESDVSTKGIEHAKNKYRLDWDEMDRKRGSKTSGKLGDIKLGYYDEKPILSTEAVKRLKDMEMEREQDEIEFIQPKIFDSFDREKFNALFELKYKHDDDDQLIKHGAPIAFNNIQGSSFISCEDDKNYDDIYDESAITGNTMFGSVNIGRKANVTRDDLNKIKGHNTEYSSHNVISSDYRSDIEKRLREREVDDELYDERKVHDFDDDNTMGGYGFMHQVGLTGRELDWEQEEIDESAMKKLIAFRQLEEKTKAKKSKRE